MLLRSSGSRVVRQGQALVEYALLLAGIAMVAVVSVAVLGNKVDGVIGVMAGIMPGAHADDNKPVFSNGELIPLDKSGNAIRLDSSKLVDPAGIDRMKDLLGPGGGELLVVD